MSTIVRPYCPPGCQLIYLARPPSTPGQNMERFLPTTVYSYHLLPFTYCLRPHGKRNRHYSSMAVMFADIWGGIDADLVQWLVTAQFPQWGDLVVTPVEVDGWDNRTYRLCEDMCVRLSLLGGAGSHRSHCFPRGWLPCRCYKGHAAVGRAPGI